MDRARRSIPNHAGATTSGVDAATNDRGETGDTVDFAHEALIGGWPKLNGWLHQHREGERDRRWLEAKASEWDRLKRQGGLLDEIELAEAERWLAGPNVADLGYSQAFAELLEASRRRVAVERERELARIRALSQARAAASALGSGLGYGAAFGIAFWLEGEARDGWAAALYGAAWFPLGVMFGLVVSIAIALPRLRDAPIRRTVVAVSAGGIVAGGIYVFARRWTVLPGDAYGWEQMVAGALTGGLLAFGIAAPPPERWRRVLQRPGVAGTSHGWMRLAVVTVLGVPGLAGAVWIEHLRWNPGTVILSGLLLGSLTGAGFLLVDVAGRNQPHNQADRPGTGVERPVGRWLRVRRPAARPPIRSGGSPC